MANELTISGSMSFSKDGVTSSVTKTGVQVTISGSKVTEIVQAVATSEEALDLGDITAPGYTMIENLDATNYVSLRRATGEGNVIKILAGKFAGPFQFEATAPFVIANTATVNIRTWIIET